MENLFSALQADTVDQSELEQLLVWHFGGAAGVSAQEIEYRHRGEDRAALVLRYDDDGELVEINPGAGLRETDLPEILQKIRDAILATSEHRVGQRVLFASVPIKGWFRYKDIFQIRPVPPEAPRPEVVIAAHPLLLEVRYAGSTESQLRMLRRTRIEREIELLCVAIMPRLNGAMGKYLRHHWVLAETSDLQHWKSRYCQELYTWPGAVGEMNDFSTVEGIEPLSRAAPDAYYTRKGISVGDELDIPDNIERLLDAFFGFPRDDRDRFLRAVFWFQYAQHTYTYSHSATFTSLVSAVEALMPPAAGGERCPTCGKALGPGATQRFVHFVEEYAPSPRVTNAQRRQLYYLRSALSHGGKLLHTDRVAWGGGFTSNYLKQWEDMDAMWGIVRVMFVNWLLRRAAD